MSEEQSAERTSVITKSIRRVYNVGKYESCEITTSYEETITWTTLSERQAKSKAISSLLISDFAETKGAVFAQMNANPTKKATLTNTVKEDSTVNVDDLGVDSLP